MSQRQDSRFNSFAKQTYGGMKCFQSLLKDGHHWMRCRSGRSCVLHEQADPDAAGICPAEVFCVNLAQDVLGPESGSARQRTTTRFQKVKVAS